MVKKNLKSLTDEELVAWVRSKDKEAYSEIINRYQTKLLRYAEFITNDPAKAADVVQEGLIKAYVNLNGFEIKKKFSSWIYRIIHNEAINHLGGSKQWVPIEANMDFDSGINIEDEVIKKHVIGQTHECLKQMPLNYREPLSLFFLEERSYEEISDILRLPIGTVGTRINRAKALMKTLCQKQLK